MSRAGAAVLRCRSCGASCDGGGHEPGTWLACAGCGEPIVVPERPLRRAEPVFPEQPGTEERPDDPRLEVKPGLEEARYRARLEADRPWRTRSRERLGCIGVAVLAMLGGLAQLLFVGVWLGIRIPPVLASSWIFGFILTAAALRLGILLAGSRGEELT